MVEIYMNEYNDDDNNDNHDSCVKYNNSKDSDGEGDNSGIRWNYLCREDGNGQTTVYDRQYQIIVGGIAEATQARYLLQVEVPLGRQVPTQQMVWLRAGLTAWDETLVARMMDRPPETCKVGVEANRTHKISKDI